MQFLQTYSTSHLIYKDYKKELLHLCGPFNFNMEVLESWTSATEEIALGAQQVVVFYFYFFTTEAASRSIGDTTSVINNISKFCVHIGCIDSIQRGYQNMGRTQWVWCNWSVSSEMTTFGFNSTNSLVGAGSYFSVNVAISIMPIIVTYSSVQINTC